MADNGTPGLEWGDNVRDIRDTVGREAVTSSSTALFRWPEVHQTHFADIEQKWWGFWIEYSVSIERRIRRSIAFSLNRDRVIESECDGITRFCILDR